MSDAEPPTYDGSTAGAPGEPEEATDEERVASEAVAMEPADARPRRSRLPLVLSSAVAVVVMGAALVAPLVDRAIRGDEEAQRALDLTAVQTWEIDDRTHTDTDVDYPQTPPAGGPHAPIWLDCGVYDEPVRDENAVHDLEHGTVWITHDPSLSADDVSALADALPDNGIMSPREDLPAPVVVTVWGAQLALDGADDPRLQLFLEEYGDGHTAPEFGVSCRGGTPDPQGALPGQGTNA